MLFDQQAPLLAYNHFVEAVLVLNECPTRLRAGVCEAASGELAQALLNDPSAPGLAGPSAKARGKRDVIYRYAACTPC